MPFPLLIACVVAPVAQGSSSIDQSHISQSNVGSVPDYVNSLGQTFTVGTTGRLTQIDLQLGRTVEAVGYVTVELRNSVNGVPGGTLLGAQLLDATTLPQINPGPNLPFTSLTGFDLPVTAGETYAIVVRRNAQQNHPYVYWCIGPPDYLGGISYVQRFDEPWHVNMEIKTTASKEPQGGPRTDNWISASLVNPRSGDLQTTSFHFLEQQLICGPVRITSDLPPK